MKVGNLVVPMEPQHGLYSGAGQWSSAVVASVEPFLLVCKESDMKWSTKKAEDFHPVGQATPEMINAIQHRLNREEVKLQVRAPEGESFCTLHLGCGLILVELGVKPLAVDLNKKVAKRAVHGSWGDEIAQGDNPSYGWLFEYSAEDGLWKAQREASEEELKTYESNIAGECVAVRKLGSELVSLVELPSFD